MPNIATPSSSRVIRGPSSSQVLKSDSLANIAQQRSLSLDWFTYLWKGNALIQAAPFAAGNDTVWQVTTGADSNFGYQLVPLGGALVTTGAGTNDAVIKANRSTGLGGAANFWAASREPGMACQIQAGNLTSNTLTSRIIIGLSSAADGNPDNALNTDCAFFHVENTATNGTLRCITKALTLLEDFDTGLTWSAQTFYTLGVFLDQGRRPHFWLNGSLIHVGPAVGTTLPLAVPSIAIEETGANPNQIGIQSLFCCRRLRLR